MSKKWEGRSSVPRLYKEASKILKRAKEEKGSLKSFIYGAKHPNIKAIHALTVEALKNSSAIDEVIERTKLLEKAPNLNPHLVHILITELLWGKKQLAGFSRPVQIVTECIKSHEKELEVYSMERQVEVYKPRYVRINTLNITLKKALRSFVKEGWEQVKYEEESVSYSDFLNMVKSLTTSQFLVDCHINTLLIFPPKTEFHHHNLYHEGKIFLQDKASCFPVQLLRPTPGSCMIDACAAPGMKTTQLAAVMNNEGKIIAVEKCPKRFKVLQSMIEKANATCVEPIHAEFTTLPPEQYPEVEYILVDPSCSGSGQVGRIDMPGYKAELEQEQQDRLWHLAGFQISALRHACMFPNVKRIVYSTCSLYEQENEEVIQRVLDMTEGQFKVVYGIRHTWENKGSKNYKWGKRCMYAIPDRDLCDGFFVAMLERVTDE